MDANVKNSSLLLILYERLRGHVFVVEKHLFPLVHFSKPFYEIVLSCDSFPHFSYLAV